MIESGPASEPVPALPDPGSANGPPVASADHLEERVRRLEDAVAQLQDTDKLEERVSERVAKRLGRKGAKEVVRTAVAVEAARIVPAAAPPPARPAGPRPPWLMFELWGEFRAILGMLFDPRYRLRWSTRLVPPGLFGLMLFSGFVLTRIPLVGLVLDKVVDLLLAFFVYKVLAREAHRYRAAVLPGAASAAGGLPS